MGRRRQSSSFGFMFWHIQFLTTCAFLLWCWVMMLAPPEMTERRSRCSVLLLFVSSWLRWNIKCMLQKPQTLHAFLYFSQLVVNTVYVCPVFLLWSENIKCGFRFGISTSNMFSCFIWKLIYTIQTSYVVRNPNKSKFQKCSHLFFIVFCCSGRDVP